MASSSLATTQLLLEQPLNHDDESLAEYAAETCRLRSEFNRIGVKFPDYPIFCTLKHYTKEANIPLKQNPNVLKPPKLEELCQHFGLSQEFIADKCHKWYGSGGDHPHDARYDAAAAYLCMLVGEKMA